MRQRDRDTERQRHRETEREGEEVEVYWRRCHLQIERDKIWELTGATFSFFCGPAQPGSFASGQGELALVFLLQQSLRWSPLAVDRRQASAQGPQCINNLFVLYRAVGQDRANAATVGEGLVGSWRMEAGQLRD